MRIAFCSTSHLVVTGKLHSETTVSTIHQGAQRFGVACFSAPADRMLLVDLSAPVPFLLRDDRFMCVRYDSPFRFIFPDELMILVRYRSCFELYQVSEIHGIMQ